MSVLAMPLTLGAQFPGKIEDVEALVRKVLRDRLRQFNVLDGRLKPHDEEDAVTYLIGVAFEASRRYDPAKERNPSRANFAAYTSKILAFRVVDWYRQRFEDTRHGEKPIVLSLDAPLSLSAGKSGVFENEAIPDRLVDTLVASTGDPAVDRAPDLVGVLHARGGGGARAGHAVGEPQARRASRGNRSSAAVKPRIPGTYRSPSRPPICPNCFSTFLSAFKQVNKKTAPELRQTVDQLEERAARRARAVRFGSEWACPRCTKLEDEKGHQMMLQQAYPNRQTRRAAAKAVGASKPRAKAKTAKR